MEEVKECKKIKHGYALYIQLSTIKFDNKESAKTNTHFISLWIDIQ